MLAKDVVQWKKINYTISALSFADISLIFHFTDESASKLFTKYLKAMKFQARDWNNCSNTS